MICLLALLLVSFVRGLSFNEYSVQYTLAADQSTGTLGRSNEASRFTSEGRASVVVLQSQTQQYMRSYSLFNATMSFDFSQTGADQCVMLTFGASLDAVFDLTSSGWLRSARSHHLGGGLVFYESKVPATAWFLSSGFTVAQVGLPAVVSLLVDRSGTPQSLNVSSASGYPPIGDLMQLTFTSFSSTLLGGANGFRDGDFAPPPNVCIDGPTGTNCKAGAIGTLDVYRTSDNDTFIKQLEAQNAADPTGEAWFLSQFTPHAFITHFRVTMRTGAYTLYQECNGGNCNCNVPSAPPNYAAILSIERGVGREEGVGGSISTDGTHQCSTAATQAQGYWFSFQINGLCASRTVGDRNCTYYYDRVKTITLACAQALMTGSTPQQQGQELLQAFQSCPAQQL